LSRPAPFCHFFMCTFRLRFRRRPGALSDRFVTSVAWSTPVPGRPRGHRTHTCARTSGSLRVVTIHPVAHESAAPGALSPPTPNAYEELIRGQHTHPYTRRRITRRCPEHCSLRWSRWSSWPEPRWERPLSAYQRVRPHSANTSAVAGQQRSVRPRFAITFPPPMRIS
jgi:hypothetical protein